MRRKPGDDLREIKADTGALAAPEGLLLLAVGIVVGAAGVLVTALFSKLLSRDLED
jgi:hypothetical protein